MFGIQSSVHCSGLLAYIFTGVALSNISTRAKLDTGTQQHIRFNIRSCADQKVPVTNVRKQRDKVHGLAK